MFFIKSVSLNLDYRMLRAETLKTSGFQGSLSLVKSPNNHLPVQARQLLLRALDSALFGYYTIKFLFVKQNVRSFFRTLSFEIGIRIHLLAPDQHLKVQMRP